MKITSKEGSITIKLSSNSTLYVQYHIDAEDAVWYDRDGGGSPAYSEIIFDKIYYNDEDITNLVYDFTPLEEFITEKIQDEY